MTTDPTTATLEQPDRLRGDELTTDQQTAIADWARLHDLDPHEVPVEPARLHLRLDPVTDEWVIPVYDRVDGKIVLDDTGEQVAWREERRPYRGDLPWPLTTMDDWRRRVAKAEDRAAKLDTASSAAQRNARVLADELIAASAERDQALADAVAGRLAGFDRAITLLRGYSPTMTAAVEYLEEHREDPA